jgi:YD repeat-containing protein
LAAAHYPFFDSAKAGDWFSGKAIFPGGAENCGSSQQKHLRLKAIKLGAEILLEHSYRPDGRLGTTRYADGETVGYEWDDLSRTLRVRSRSGRDTLIKLRADDLVETVTYDGTLAFRYEYDLNDHPCKLTYPDGVASQRAYGQRDELLSADVGSVRTTFRWTTEGDFEGYIVQSASTSHELNGKAGDLECKLAVANPVSVPSAAQTKPPVFDHPLGQWRMTPTSGLEEMVTPWGDRFRVQSVNQGSPATVWGPSGRHSFEYAKSGVISAITHPDGSHSMIHALKDQPKAIVVNPCGVTLLEYDAHGRLSKSRDGNGGYCLYDYARNGLAKKIETFFETVRLAHDKRNHLTLLKFADDCVCSFTHYQNGALQGLILNGLATHGLTKISGFLGFLWKWLALRPTLRLENEVASRKGCAS